jgi:beta-galactosidase beta subunit
MFDKMREIEDYRKKSDYQLAELRTRSIAMFIFKEGSRNAFNNDRPKIIMKSL